MESISDNSCTPDLQIQNLSNSIQCIFFSHWHSYMVNVISILSQIYTLAVSSCICFTLHLLLDGPQSSKAHPHHIAHARKILLSQCLLFAMWAVLKTQQGVTAAGCSDSKPYSRPFQGQFSLAIVWLLDICFSLMSSSPLPSILKKKLADQKV